ncbi:alpha-amylase family glycosyl hydrolase [Hymenobacter sp. DH14]|uniref:Alpha-amylase family glycosyl hydrolase n=1 Tax=Hymenobacter cyanobacteriorum TaxID=2926463 RepID=A0A9X1VIW0_9BACT|nr:alpha-amylase family glycosyl hydrolase [Hymenobacter cyanobacteriorum]MCI1190004.1 alpha-amylase family glycosyl hydrolase [Hymenobacter cyanobacteriorum]
MFVRHIIVKNSLALLLAVGLLAGCKKDSPTPPDPVVVPPVTTTPTPPQYGTPFAGVPNREDAVLYQVNMRAFSSGANFAGVTARLDSIKNLGVNVVYLMPIYPVGKVRAVNSPYAVQDYRAVNPEFGTLADLRTLVDAAHARGLSVMLDWVANHTSWDNAWITAHPDWYLQSGGTIQSPPGTNYTDVAQLNFNNASMRAEMISAMKSWVFTANVDGLRFDYADAPTIAATDFWKQAVDTLRNVKTHKLLLLAEGSLSANFASGFDYNFGFNFYGGIYNVYRNGATATVFDGLNNSEYMGASGTQQVVRYITNHDVNGSDGTPVGLFGGDAGAMSAFVIASLYKGVPMVYNGQEVGMTTPITFPFTSVKVNWNGHPDVTYAYRRLLKARAASAALRRGTPTAYSTANVCAFTKTAGTEQAFVLANVRNTATTYTVPAALAGTTWTNALTGASTSVGATVALPAYGYLVLKK